MLISAMLLLSAASFRPVVQVHREPSGKSLLRVVPTETRPAHFQLLTVCRYDGTLQKWEKASATTSPKSRDVLARLPAAAGLYWVEWSENEHTVNALAFVGPVLCNDIMLGKAPDGMIATCVPLEHSALATFVPDPAVECKK